MLLSCVMKDITFVKNYNTEKNLSSEVEEHPNLFVTGKFLYSQYGNKEENTEGTEDLFLYRPIFVKSVFVRTIFDCSSIHIRPRATNNKIT